MSPSTRKQALTADAIAFYSRLRDLLKVTGERDPRVVCAWGVTVTECHALEHIANAGPCTVNALAEHLGLDKSTTSRTVTSLVGKRLVRRARHPNDRRATHLMPTPKGAALAAAVRAANRETYAEALGTLSAKERAELIATLTRIVSLVKTLEPKPVN